MKITIYELLGMIKEGKQPKHIKYRDEEWWWGYDTYTYFADLERTPDAQTSLFDRYKMNYCLDNEVEIIEDNKKIEKLNMSRFIGDDIPQEIFDIAHKVDELIDEVNKLKDKQ